MNFRVLEVPNPVFGVPVSKTRYYSPPGRIPTYSRVSGHGNTTTGTPYWDTHYWDTCKSLKFLIRVPTLAYLEDFPFSGCQYFWCFRCPCVLGVPVSLFLSFPPQPRMKPRVSGSYGVYWFYWFLLVFMTHFWTQIPTLSGLTH